MDWREIWKAVREAGMVRPADDDIACGSVIVSRAGAIVLDGRRVFAEFVFEAPFDIIDGWRFAHWKISEMIPAAPGGKDEE